MKKIIPTNQTEDDNNEIVEISILAEDGQLYDCVGVLVKENPDALEIAFSARNNIIHDRLKIKKKHIKNIKFIKTEEIGTIE